MGGPRLLYRWAKDSYLESQAGQGVLIIGAGRAGEMLLRDLFHDPEQRYHPVGFLDDDPSKTGREIHGVRVLGPCETLCQCSALLSLIPGGLGGGRQHAT